MFNRKLLAIKKIIPYVLAFILILKKYKQSVLSYIFILKTMGIWDEPIKKGLTQNKIKIFMYIHLTHLPTYLPK